MDHFVITYFYYTGTGLKRHHSFTTFDTTKFTEEFVIDQANDVSENNRDIDGYILTKQHILASSY